MNECYDLLQEINVKRDSIIRERDDFMNDIQKELFNELSKESQYITIGKDTGKEYKNISVAEMVDSLIKMNKIFKNKKSNIELHMAKLYEESEKLTKLMYEKKDEKDYHKYNEAYIKLYKIKREKENNECTCDYLSGCIDTIDSILVSIEATNILNA